MNVSEGEADAEQNEPDQPDGEVDPATVSIASTGHSMRERSRSLLLHRADRGGDHRPWSRLR